MENVDISFTVHTQIRLTFIIIAKGDGNGCSQRLSPSVFAMFLWSGGMEVAQNHFSRQSCLIWRTFMYFY